MDINIAEKLIPNLMTMLAQLCATGILFLVYKKYIHSWVMNYLNKKEEKLNEAETLAAQVEEKARKQERDLDDQRQKMMASMDQMQRSMEKSMEKERQELLAQTEADNKRLAEQAQRQIERDKAEMMKDVEQYAVGLALTLTERVLDNYELNEQTMLNALKLEMSRIHEKN